MGFNREKETQMKESIRKTTGLTAAAALVLGVTLVGAAAEAKAGDKAPKYDTACLLAGDIYTSAPAESLIVTFVLQDATTGEVVYEVEQSAVEITELKGKGGYEYVAFLANDPDLTGDNYEWSLRVDARAADAPVYIDWFEQVVSKKWEKLLGDKLISLFPGGDIAGRVELVAITKSDSKIKKLKKMYW
jgi:hypothetical protein